MKRSWTAVIGPLAWLAVALLFILAARQLDLGTLRRLGPGAYPMAAAVLLAVLSVSLAAATLLSGDAAPRADWAPAIAVCTALAAFALLSPLVGVLPAAFCAVLAASLPDRALRWWGKLLLGLAVAAGVWLIFIWGLRLPFIAFRGL